MVCRVDEVTNERTPPRSKTHKSRVTLPTAPRQATHAREQVHEAFGTGIITHTPFESCVVLRERHLAFAARESREQLRLISSLGRVRKGSALHGDRVNLLPHAWHASSTLPQRGLDRVASGQRPARARPSALLACLPAHLPPCLPACCAACVMAKRCGLVHGRTRCDGRWLGSRVTSRECCTARGPRCRGEQRVIWSLAACTQSYVRDDEPAAAAWYVLSARTRTRLTRLDRPRV